MLTTILRPEDVLTIGRLGAERAPSEACGVVIPTPHKGRRVWEMPNRHPDHGNNFEMWGTDITLSLGKWFEQPNNGYQLHDLIFWHTHPSGGTGPSPTDLEGRREDVCNLIVSLTENGPVPTFF